MTDFDLANLQAAANADPRPKASIPDEIPSGTSPADQAIAGYTMAVNLVTRAADLDCDADWRRRQRIYATEIARGPREVGTTRTEMVERMSATVDKINALTQRLIDEYRPGASVYDFLSARTLDTTVPRY
jgi:hypothetical protein